MGAWIVIALGGLFLAAGMAGVRKSMRMKRWVETPGQVTARDVMRDNWGPNSDENTPYWNAQISYRFDFRGVAYTGLTIRDPKPAFSSREEAKAFLDAIPDAVTVWVDPDDPSACVLTRSSGGPGWVGVAAGLAIVALGVALWLGGAQG